MIINNGPIGNGKLNLEKDILIKYSNEEFSPIISPGVENVYDFYNEEEKGWILICYSDCELKIKKNLKDIDIGLVGGGGGGGACLSRTGSNGNSKFSGGGGGSGAEIKKQEDIKKFSSGIYKINIGKGGAGSFNGDVYAGKDYDNLGTGINPSINNHPSGEDGLPSSIVKNNIEILTALGGKGGENAEGNSASGGAGGMQNDCASGGRGVNAAHGDDNGSQYGQNARYIFMPFLASKKDAFSVASGGGGGGGALYSEGTYNWGGKKHNSGKKYGQGGDGADRTSSTDNHLEEETNIQYGEYGGDGLFILRHVLNKEEYTYIYPYMNKTVSRCNAPSMDGGWYYGGTVQDDENIISLSNTGSPYGFVIKFNEILPIADYNYLGIEINDLNEKNSSKDNNNVNIILSTTDQLNSTWNPGGDASTLPISLSSIKKTEPIITPDTYILDISEIDTDCYLFFSIAAHEKRNFSITRIFLY